MPQRFALRCKRAAVAWVYNHFNSRVQLAHVSKITAYFGDRERTLRRVALMVLLYSILPVQALLPIDDPDIWWRLRMGRWIVDHQSVPYVDYFSAYDAGKPWFTHAA